MLATVCENYYALHSHLEKLQSRQSPESEQTEPPTKKRKQDTDELLLGFPIGLGSGKTDNSSSNEDHHQQKNQLLSCKRPVVTDSFNKAKVSTVLVPADSSDTSLVSGFV